MTVYSQINTNKFRTFLIVGLFIFIVSGFFFLIGKYFEAGNTYFTMGILFSFVSSIGSYFYSDKIVLFTTGATEADREKYFDLYTVTENLALADGLPKPKIYVINDPAPNAFATGRDPKHAVVAATTGLLETLNRAELEGVIAHELSHIKNYDILLSSMVAVLVGSVALVSDWIMRSLWWGGMRNDEDDRERSRSPVLFVLLIVSLIIAPLVATLIQLAISRRRELLADASGVLVTRYPEGLARALEKISQYPYSMRHATASTAHLFIANPFKKGKASSFIASLFSTHPPPEERIKILRSM